MLAKITRLFSLWAILFAVVAYFAPATFTPIRAYTAELLMCRICSRCLQY